MERVVMNYWMDEEGFVWLIWSDGVVERTTPSDLDARGIVL